MKNHWIKESVNRKFYRLTRIIDFHRAGLYTIIRSNSLVVYVKSEELVVISFDRLDNWFIEYQYDASNNFWCGQRLPRYEDPAFIPRIELMISRAFKNWEAEKDKKCETSSSS